MRIILLFSLLIVTLPCLADDAATLNFSIRVKNEIQKIFLEGQQRYDYDDKKNLVRTWKDKNISAMDMDAYLKAYNTAHDIERKIRLSNELKNQKFIYTDFSEHISPTFLNQNK